MARKKSQPKLTVAEKKDQVKNVLTEYECVPWMRRTRAWTTTLWLACAEQGSPASRTAERGAGAFVVAVRGMDDRMQTNDVLPLQARSAHLGAELEDLQRSVFDDEKDTMEVRPQQGGVARRSLE